MPEKTDLELALSTLDEEPSAAELAAFLHAKPPAGEGELTRAELEDDWRVIERRLSPPAPQGVVSLPVLPFEVRAASPPPLLRRLGTWRALAAAGLLGWVGLAGWMLLERAPGGAEANAAIAFLEPRSETVRGEERALGGRAAKVVLRDGPLALLLDLSDENPDLTYEATLLRRGAGDSDPIGSIAGLRENNEARLGLVLPQHWLRPGVYAIEVHAVSPNERRPIASYEFELVAAPPAAAEPPAP